MLMGWLGAGSSGLVLLLCVAFVASGSHWSWVEGSCSCSFLGSHVARVKREKGKKNIERKLFGTVGETGVGLKVGRRETQEKTLGFISGLERQGWE